MKTPSKYKSYLEVINPLIENLELDQEQLVVGLNHAKVYLEKLYQWFQKNQPLDKACQIKFFKFTKAEPLSHFIYFMQVKDYLSQKPVLDERVIQEFHRIKMAEVNRFFRDHHELIGYIENEETHLDVHYFVRRGNMSFVSHNLLFLDTNFTTSHDTLFARCKAMILYAQFLRKRNSNSALNPSKKPNGKLRWTGQKVDLVELIYALHVCGVFNNGNASLKKIAVYLQDEFGCELKDFYRCYSELRYRKKSRTRFLDNLSSKLRAKMEMEDS